MVAHSCILDQQRRIWSVYATSEDARIEELLRFSRKALMVPIVEVAGDVGRSFGRDRYGVRFVRRKERRCIQIWR